MCTLTQFPYLADHCIEWAKVTFKSLYEGGPGALQKLVEDKDAFLVSVAKAAGEEKVSMLRDSLKWAAHAKAIKAAGDYSQQVSLRCVCWIVLAWGRRCPQPPPVLDTT